MLPGYEIKNALVDFSPVTNAIESNQQNALARRKLEQEDQRIGLERERHSAAMADRAEQRQMRQVQRWGMQAQVIDEMPDGPQKQALSQQFYQANPALIEHATKIGVSHQDPRFWKFLRAEAGNYDPLKQRLAEAQISSANASAGLHNAQAGAVGQTDDIREYNFARSKGGFSGTFEDWMKVKSSGALKYGLNPVPYQKPDGSIGYMVPNTQGEARELQIPGGGQAMPKASAVQTPTQVIINDQFGRELRRENKDIAGKEAQEEVGKAAGQAQVNLPRIEENSARALKTIDDIRKHPGKQYGVGAQGVLPGIPGTRQAGFVQLVEQAKGQAFLEAFNALRGGGQITEIEGTKATQALARMNRAQSMQDFDQALSDYEDVIKTGMARARRSAAPVRSQAPPPTTLPPGWSFQRAE